MHNLADYLHIMVRSTVLHRPPSIESPPQMNLCGGDICVVPPAILWEGDCTIALGYVGLSHRAEKCTKTAFRRELWIDTTLDICKSSIKELPQRFVETANQLILFFKETPL